MKRFVEFKLNLKAWPTRTWAAVYYKMKRKPIKSADTNKWLHNRLNEIQIYNTELKFKLKQRVQC